MWKISRNVRSLFGPICRRPVSTKSSLQIAFDTKREIKRSRNSVGLFSMPELVEPAGFYTLEQEVFNDAESLVKEATSPSRDRKLVQIFDQLSDSLCRVADMAEFVRVTHPDEAYTQAAENACIQLGSLVERLNTDTALYKSLLDVVQSGDKFEEDSIDKRVAELFLFDFQQSGVHLEDNKKAEFLNLTQKILMTGNMFMQNTARPVKVPRNKVPPIVNMWFSVKGNDVSVTGLFSENPSDTVRECAYKLYLHEDPEQKELLRVLLTSRYELAQLVGFDSYGHRTLCGTMAETPENVLDFLNSLSEELRPRAEKDFKELEEMKHRLSKKDKIMPWDFPFYSGLAKEAVIEVGNSDLADFFTLGNCMEGLNMIFTSIYGVTLEHQEAEPGELWHHDVHKLVVNHETEGTLGVIYCDFFDRQGKFPQDCHFTIRGGREKEDGSYQQPAVVLHLNLPHPPPTRPCLLTPAMVENLFHEFGHAMHSMLGRTRYQHVTGTRCPTDFAEVPSVLMEYFFSEPQVLSRIARHYASGQPLPPDMVEDLCKAKKKIAAAEMQQQLFYSMIDQVYHGPMPLEGCTTEVLSKVQKQYFSLPYVPSTAWQLRFGHFVGYGAKYYSYLMSRAVASQIWHQCFKKDPFSRSMGERYRSEVLAHGGGKHPAELVEGLLGEKPTTKMLVNSLIEDLES